MSEQEEKVIRLYGPERFKKWILAGLVAVVALLTVLSSIAIVQSGTVGVVIRLGAVQDQVFQPGFNVKIPFVTRVVPLNVQTKKVEVDSTASSQDLQLITTGVAVNFHVDPDRASWLYKNVGMSYQQTIIEPAIHESVKAVIARFTAEQLVTQRQEVSANIKEELGAKCAVYGIVTDDFNITNLDFSAEFNAAIEAKQTAQQQALKAEQDLARVTIEAQQKVEQAKADAEATRARADAEAYAIQTVNDQLAQSDRYIEYRKIEKWNGELPKVTGDSNAIIDFRDIETSQPAQ